MWDLGLQHCKWPLEELIVWLAATTAICPLRLDEQDWTFFVFYSLALTAFGEEGFRRMLTFSMWWLVEQTVRAQRVMQQLKILIHCFLVHHIHLDMSDTACPPVSAISLKALPSTLPPTFGDLGQCENPFSSAVNSKMPSMPFLVFP